MKKYWQEMSTKSESFLANRKEIELIKEKRKIEIWKKLIHKRGLIRYPSFSLVSNIHQRINIRGNDWIYNHFTKENLFQKYLCKYQLSDAFQIKKPG